MQAIHHDKQHKSSLNDNVHIHHYDEVMESLKESFQSILPEKSSFELND